MKIATTRTLERQDFIDVISSALEGASNYWYMLNEDEFEKDLPKTAGEFNCLSEKIGAALYDNPEFKLPVYDVEGEYGEEGEPLDLLGSCTQETCIKALTLLDKDYPHILQNILEENYDAWDADTFFQLAVMGEVVYG